MSETTAGTRAIDALLAEYGESHQNPTNKQIHWIAVPIIFWTVVALLWSIPVPEFFAKVPYLNWATVALVLVSLYYIVLSPALALGMIAFSVAMIALTGFVVSVTPIALWQLALIIFVVAWIAQFWGHKIEGKKPSFFKDIQFLLIGPAWLMHFIYKKLGIAY